MSRHRLIVPMILLLVTSACASGRGVNSDSARRARAEALLRTGRWVAAFDELAVDLMRPSVAYRDEAMRIIKPYPGFAPGLVDHMSRDIAGISTPSDARPMKRRVELLAMANIANPADIERLHADLARVVAEGNASGRLPFLFSDPVSEFPTLRTDDATAVIFTRSLRRLLEEKPPSDRLLEGTMAYAAGRGTGSPDHATLEKALPAIDFTTTQLRGIVSQTYPAFAKSAIAALSVSVYFITEPSRRLLEEDVGGILQRRSPLLQLTRQPESHSVSVIIRELQYDERQAQERTRTITVGYGEHDLGVAVLLLPRNASTLFEVTEGGAEITWAFEIIGRHGGRVIHEELVRDQIDAKYHYCTNFRVVNVFGGVLRASTFPNGQVRSFCESGRQPIKASSLRATVLDRLADAVARVPPIADAVRRTR